LKTANVKILKEIHKFKNSKIDNFGTEDLVYKKEHYFKGENKISPS